MYNIIIPGGEIKYMEAMRYVQTVYLAGDSRAAAKLLRRLLLTQSEKAYPFSGGYAFLLLSDSARCRFPPAPFREAYQSRRCYGADRAYSTVRLSSPCASVHFRRTLDHGTGSAGDHYFFGIHCTFRRNML